MPAYGSSEEGVRAVLRRVVSGCSVSGLGRALEALLLLVVLVWQGSTLDFYLIHHHQGSVAWYFWFLADFLVLVTLMSAVFVARRHHSRPVRPADPGGGGGAADPGGAHTVLGRFPLCYISWLLYSFLLVAKIILLFRLDIAQLLQEDLTTVYSAQFLKAVVAGTALVFLLLVENHHAATVDSEQRTYLGSLCTGTTFEVLDSVTFLGLLFPRETHLTLTYPLENAVLALACVNFVLPGLLLFKLSQCEFGQQTRPLGLKLLYRLLRLALVDAPYLGVRCYLWAFVGHDVSLFVIKNVLGIYGGIRSLLPELRLYCRLLGKSGGHRRPRDALELKAIYTKHGDEEEENSASPNKVL